MRRSARGEVGAWRSGCRSAAGWGDRERHRHRAPLRLGDLVRPLFAAEAAVKLSRKNRQRPPTPEAVLDMARRLMGLVANPAEAPAKSARERFLDAEAKRMKQRAFEERQKKLYAEFIEHELVENAKNRLDPKWRKAWDAFHDHWLKHRLPADTGSPAKKAQLARAGKS